MEAKNMLIDVGGYRLRLRRRGEGFPVVVFDSGCGGCADDWETIAEATGRLTTSLSYDRAGAGESDPGPLPRSSLQIVKELEILLEQSRVAPPYVLVGLSFGGLNVRLFARRNPGKVAGLVLLESAHEDIPTRFPASLWAEEERYLAQLQGIAGAEAATVHLSGAQVRDHGTGLGDLPLLVLTGGTKWKGIADPEERTLVNRIWNELQSEIVALSTRGEQWFAPASGHNIHIDDPGLVEKAIEHVVALSRG